jgi:hypothetical protein
LKRKERTTAEKEYEQNYEAVFERVTEALSAGEGGKREYMEE